jgi:hypothetical protein
MSTPLYGAKYAIIGSGLQMPQILALTAEHKSAQECVERSGWKDDPTVVICELRVVSKEKDTVIVGS